MPQQQGHRHLWSYREQVHAVTRSHFDGSCLIEQFTGLQVQPLKAHLLILGFLSNDFSKVWNSAINLHYDVPQEAHETAVSTNASIPVWHAYKSQDTTSCEATLYYSTSYHGNSLLWSNLIAKHEPIGMWQQTNLPSQKEKPGRNPLEDGRMPVPQNTRQNISQVGSFRTCDFITDCASASSLIS